MVVVCIEKTNVGGGERERGKNPFLWRPIGPCKEGGMSDARGFAYSTDVGNYSPFPGEFPKKRFFHTISHLRKNEGRYRCLSVPT